MNETSNTSPTDNPVWSRIVSMLVLGFAYAVAEAVLIAIVIGQVLFGIFSRRQNEPLKRMGQQVSDYIYQILVFLTFNSVHRPFPYQGWGEKDSALGAMSTQDLTTKR